MRLNAVLLILASASLLAGCAAPENPGAGAAPVTQTVPVSPQASPKVSGNVPQMSAPDGIWRMEDRAGPLAAASCPPGTRPQAPLPIDLSVAAVSLGEPDQIASRIPETATLAGAWELSSPNSNFGGLSGLALLPASAGGGLLTVSDAGAFVWIGLENGAPASAKIAYMQGADGQQITGKEDGDAEGLVWSNGLALVSFERNFRIDAFALEACGAAARAAPVATLPETHDGRNIDENQGPEALFLSPSAGLGFGYEGMLGTSPLGRVQADGTALWTGETAPTPALHGLVGREVLPQADGGLLTLSLLRAWDPIRGNRIRLTWGSEEADALTLSRPLLVDNFEGLTAETLPNGAIRVWIVSDNNFSADQRTLLYAFDIAISQD